MKTRIRLLITAILLIYTHQSAKSQIVGSKDCIDALPLVNWQTVTYLSTEGEGLFPNEVDNTMSCLNSGEQNSGWFQFYISYPGVVSFSIIPEAQNADYDWAVYDITDGGCDAIFNDPTTSISCNFSGSTFPTSATGPNNGGNPQDEPVIQVEENHIYVILVNHFSGINMSPYQIDFTGTTAVLGPYNEIIGRVSFDSNNDCTDNIDLPSSGYIVKAYDANNQAVGLAYTQPNGNYAMGVSTQFNPTEVRIEPLPYPFEEGCAPYNQQITIAPNAENVILDQVNFSYTYAELCTQFEIEYVALLYRRCFSEYNHVKIKNAGSLNIGINDFTLTYPNEFVYPLLSNVPFENVGNNEYLFHPPALELFQEFIVHVLDTVQCELELDAEICVDAQMTTQNTCGDSLNEELNIAMHIDSATNQIILENIGLVNMSNSLLLKVYNFYPNQTPELEFSSTQFIQLNAGESNAVSTYSPLVLATLIDLNSQLDNIQVGNVPGYALSDTVVYDPSAGFDHACGVVIGAYDPNDKLGFPAGLGELNRIEPEQMIQYRIRFQNTGSDTAFTVLIRDTLTSYLDPYSIVPGASSHPYTFYLDENRVRFLFNNINLLPEEANEAESIGFVDFKIKQKPNNPVSYNIDNQAAIYFDFNEPIYTPVHRYSIYPLPLSTNSVVQERIEIFPNPSTGMINIGWKKEWNPFNKQVRILDLEGRIIRTFENQDLMHPINCGDLAKGCYFIEVLVNGEKRFYERWIKL